MLDEVVQGRKRSRKRGFAWVQGQSKLCCDVIDQGEQGKQVGVDFGQIWLGCGRWRAGDVFKGVEGGLAKL